MGPVAPMRRGTRLAGRRVTGDGGGRRSAQSRAARPGTSWLPASGPAGCWLPARRQETRLRAAPAFASGGCMTFMKASTRSTVTLAGCAGRSRSAKRPRVWGRAGLALCLAGG